MREGHGRETRTAHYLKQFAGCDGYIWDSEGVLGNDSTRPVVSIWWGSGVNKAAFPLHDSHR